MTVPFTVEGGVWLALVRAGSVAGLLSLLGTLSFRAFVMPRCMAGVRAGTAWLLGQRLLRLGWASLAAALSGVLAWTLAQSADMAGAGTMRQALAAMPEVVLHTRFGQVASAEAAVLLVAAACLWRWPGRVRLVCALAALACAVHAGHGHAAAMVAGPSLLLAAEILHLWAAGVWLGGLLPLLIVVRGAPPRVGATAARWFSPLGQACLYGLTLTAAYQGFTMVGSVAGLVGTAYGWMALGKLGLFGVLFGFAVVNRYRLAPALLCGHAARARLALTRSIAVQTVFGLGIVGAAAVLGSLPPAMHVQPVWPFPVVFSLDTVREAPEFRDEVAAAVLGLIAAAVLAAGAMLLRRRLAAGYRLAGLAGAAGLAWFAAPHLSLLFVPGYPTSYYASPTGFAAGSIVAGLALYPAHCAVCHGTVGHGDGPAAASLPVPPADLTAGHLWMHGDGALFWWLSHGMAGPEGGMVMPGFAGMLTDEQIWNLIDAIRVRNAGLAFRADGAWPQPVAAPGLQAECADGRIVALGDLRGGFIRLVFGRAAAVPGVTTIVTEGVPAAPGVCVAVDGTAAAAYAAVTGWPAAAMDGVQVLIDGEGWLRAVQGPGASASWNDPAALAAVVAGLRAVPGAAGGRKMDMAM